MPLPVRLERGLGMNVQIAPNSRAISPAAMRKKTIRSAEVIASE